MESLAEGIRQFQQCPSVFPEVGEGRIVPEALEEGAG
jgi:hypothetical protein